MTREEKSARVAEIEAELERIEYKLDQLDVQQFTRKLVINSSYGSLSSRSNPIGDDDLANAITVMGSASIQQVNVIAIDWVRRRALAEYARLREEAPEGMEGDADRDAIDAAVADIEGDERLDLRIITFNDTDSLGFSLTIVPIKVFEHTDEGEIKVTEEGYALVETACEDINAEFNRWFAEKTNTINPLLNFKREKICDLGVWLKKGNSDEEAKKNYIVRVIDNEGELHNDGRYFKYTGVKLARSVVPKALKELAKRVVEEGVFSRRRQVADGLVQRLYDAYVEMPVDDKAAIQRCNNMEQYVGPDFTCVLGTPGHIRAAATYNRVISDEGLVHLEPLRSGDTAKIVQVTKDNRWGVEKVAYKDTWPPEFDGLFKLDHKTGFSKIIYDEICRIYKSVDWGSFNPAEKFSVSLLDLLGL